MLLFSFSLIHGVLKLLPGKCYFILQLNLRNLCEMDCVLQGDEDYGIDWDGPHNHHGRVTVPEVQLPCQLEDDEVASLPGPVESCSDAMQIYLETVQRLSRMMDER